MTRTGWWRLGLAVYFGWALLVVALYAGIIEKLPAFPLRHLFQYMKEFFLWQALGFSLLVLASAFARPPLVGRLAALYLALSTAALLAFSHRMAVSLAFVVFLLWCAAVVASLRLAIVRIARDQATWGLATGALYACMIPVAFVLGVLKIMTGWWVAATAIAVALPGAVDFVRCGRARWRSFLTRLDDLSPIGAAVLEAIWIPLALALVSALAPETASDAVRVHLPYIQQVARDQGFVFNEIHPGRCMIRAAYAFCAAGYALGSYELAKWLSWFSTVALTLVVSEEVVRRSGRLDLGAFSGAAVLACPLLLFLSTTLFQDHMMTLLCTVAFISLFRGLESSSLRGVLFSAFLMGGAVQTKYNALIFGIVWVLLLLAHAIKQHRLAGGLRWSIAPVLCFAAAGSPWYIYVWLTTGNPVFPYLNNLFQSPYFATDVSSVGNLTKFQWGESIWSWIFFPWTMTFHTSRIHQSPDGDLGFLFLVLFPLMLVTGRDRARAGLGLGLAGALCFLAACAYTPYARYWLPAYPLMLMPLILALGSSTERIRWRPPGYLTPFLAVALLAALLFPTPFWTATWRGFPWRVYTGETSEDTWLTRFFKGYPAIQELNGFLAPGEKVLATGYPAVHTIDGAAYEFPFFATKRIGIRDAESLQHFLSRHSIRYWIIDFSSRLNDAFYFNRLADVNARYWNEQRLVAASHGVAVFDLEGEDAGPRLELITENDVSPVLLPEASPADGIPAAAWQDLNSHKTQRAARVVSGGIEIPPQGSVAHSFSVPAAAELCKVVIELSGQTEPRVRLILEWLTDEGQKIGTVGVRVAGRMPERRYHLYGKIPRDAVGGRLLVRPSGSELGLMEARVGFFKPTEPTPIDLSAAAQATRKRRR